MYTYHKNKLPAGIQLSLGYYPVLKKKNAKEKNLGPIMYNFLTTLLYRVPLDSKGKNFVIFISRICLLNLEANAFRR